MTFHWTEKVNYTGDFITPVRSCSNWREKEREERERKRDREREGERYLNLLQDV